MTFVLSFYCHGEYGASVLPCFACGKVIFCREGLSGSDKRSLFSSDDDDDGCDNPWTIDSSGGLGELLFFPSFTSMQLICHDSFAQSPMS